MKTYKYYDNLIDGYHGQYNIIENSSDLLESWYSSAEFYKTLEEHYRQNAKWYEKEVRELNRKIDEQLALSEIAKANKNDYYELIGRAICAKETIKEK